MIIAINTRTPSGNAANRQSLIEQCTRLAALHPEHEFVWVSADKKAADLPTSTNMRQLQLPQSGTSTLLLQYWYRFTLPNAVRKLGASILVSADATCAISNKLPQLMLVNDLAFQQQPAWYHSNYCKWMKQALPVFAARARRLVVGATPMTATLLQQFPSIKEKLTVLQPSANIGFTTLTDEVAAATKQQYADEKEYFLFCGSIHARSELVNLLKAFSLFKKRQKSSMQLVLASAEPIYDTAFVESLRLYKYRTEVHLLANQPTEVLQRLTGAAYASINLAPLPNDVAQLINAIECRVPVIAGDSDTAKAILGEAALYAATDDPSSIATYLMHLYKDETSRKDLIQKGVELAERQTPEQYFATLWQLVLDTIAAA